MVTVIKTEVNFTDYEWISDASEEELIKYDVVEETVNTWSEEPLSKPLSKPSPLKNPVLAGSRSPSPCFIVAGAESKPTPVKILCPTFETRLDQKDPASILVEYKSKLCSGVCCASALQRRAAEGPLKKRILMREGFAKPASGQLTGRGEPTTRSPVDEDAVDAKCPSNFASPCQSDATRATSSADANDVKLESIDSNPLGAMVDDKDSASEDPAVVVLDPVNESTVLDDDYDDYDPYGGTWKKVVLRASNSESDPRTKGPISYEYICDKPDENLSQWGRIRFRDRVFPFVFRESFPIDNGAPSISPEAERFKIAPMAVVVRLFYDRCRCGIPKAVVRSMAVKIFASWDEVQLIEGEKICKETCVRSGDDFLQVDSFFACHHEIVEKITRRHYDRKIRKDCSWLTYYSILRDTGEELQT